MVNKQVVQGKFIPMMLQYSPEPRTVTLKMEAASSSETSEKYILRDIRVKKAIIWATRGRKTWC